MGTGTDYIKGEIRTDSGLFLDKGNEKYNVCHSDFAGGAKGDGVTDDTEAIQAAIDNAQSGDVIFFPATPDSKYYLITSALVLPAKNGIVLQGAGRRSSQIRISVAGKTCIESAAVAGGANINGHTIRDLWLEGNSIAKYGIDMQRWNRSQLINVRIADFETAGIYMKNTLLVDFLHCEFDNNKDGILEDGTAGITGPNGCSWIGCIFENQDQYCMNMYQVSGCLISGCVFESSGNGGVRVTTAGAGLAIVGNYFEANNVLLTSNPFDIQIGSASAIEGVTIDGNYFNGDASDADYYPLRIIRANGMFVGKGNNLNTSNKYIDFESNTGVLHGEFHTPGFDSGTFSETLTFINLGVNIFDQGIHCSFPGWVNLPEGTIQQDRVRTGSLPVLIGLYTVTNAGTGAAAQGSGSVTLDTGTTSSSTSRIVATQLGLFAGQGQGNVNWDADQRWTFVISNIASGTTNGQTWLGLFTADAAANPTADAIGFRIDDDAIKGFTHNGSTLTVVDLSTSFTAGVTTILEIRFKDQSIQWFINGVLAGNNDTSSQMPSGDGVAGKFVIAVANGGDSARQRIEVMQIDYRIAP